MRLNRVPPIRCAPQPRLRHLLLRPRHRRPGQPTEPLVERDVDAVGQGRDLGRGVAQVRRRLPDPRPVEVQRDAALAAGRRERHELVPRGQEVAGVPQRQLEQGGAEPSADRCEVLGLRHRRAVGEQGELEPVQQPRAVALVLEQVRQRRDRHPSRAARVAPDPQHRLLGHHPAREHRGSRLAEQLGDPALERRDGPVLAVAVPRSGLVQGCRDVGEVAQLGRRGGRRPPDEGAGQPGLGRAGRSAQRRAVRSSVMGSSSPAGAPRGPRRSPRVPRGLRCGRGVAGSTSAEREVGR